MLTDICKRAKELGITIGQESTQTLKEKGYVKNDCFGWEKLEVLKRFGLEKIKTGKFVDVPADNYMDYLRYKKRIEENEDIARQMEEAQHSIENVNKVKLT